MIMVIFFYLLVLGGIFCGVVSWVTKSKEFQRLSHKAPMNPKARKVLDLPSHAERERALKNLLHGTGNNRKAS